MVKTGALAEIVQERFCRLEVGAVEPLGKPVVDRLQQRHPTGRSALIEEQLREARGGAQFPGPGALPARPVERLPKVMLGRCRGAGRALQQQQLALDAEQLGNAPAFFGAATPGNDRTRCSSVCSRRDSCAPL